MASERRQVKPPFPPKKAGRDIVAMEGILPTQTPDRSAPEDLVEALAGVLRLADEGRCPACLRPPASDDDWTNIPEGEGEHLYWDPVGSCQWGGNVDRDAFLAEALAPTVARLVREAEERAVGERLAGVERYVDSLAVFGSTPSGYERGYNDATRAIRNDLRVALHPKETAGSDSGRSEGPRSDERGTPRVVGPSEGDEAASEETL